MIDITNQLVLLLFLVQLIAVLVCFFNTSFATLMPCKLPFV